MKKFLAVVFALGLAACSPRDSLLTDGRIEYWKDGAPMYWAVSGGGTVGLYAEDAYETPRLRIVHTGGPTEFVSQTVTNLSKYTNREFTLECQIMADKPHVAGIFLDLDGNHLIYESNKTNGIWEIVKISSVFSSNSQIATVNLVVTNGSVVVRSIDWIVPLY